MLETIFVALQLFQRMEELLHTCKKNTKTFQCTSIAHAATLQVPGSLWMYRDVSHISHIVEMNTVENSTYQVSVVDNLYSSPHLARNLSVAMR